ncbi:hypothetical protein IIA79_03435 [bacterium]|nr:hypothetical protein [bacterium]
MAGSTYWGSGGDQLGSGIKDHAPGSARASWLGLLVSILLLLLPSPAAAQTAGLDQLSDWYLSKAGWRSTSGLPVDIEFAPPLTAHYNWAYGVTALGLNMRGVGSSDFYTVFAIYQDGLLDSLDVIGPLSGSSQWDSGPYHMAAGLPDGRIVVWLTAPREDPRQFTLADSYAPGSPIDVVVHPSDPLQADWENWWITAAFEYNALDPTLLVSSSDGDGKSMGFFQTIALPGELRSVAYLDYPGPRSSIAYLLYTVVRDRRVELGNNQHTTTYAAWYVAGQSWRVQTLRNSGLYSGGVFIGGASQGPFGMVAWDESDIYSISGGAQLLNITSQDGVQVQTSIGARVYLSNPMTTGISSFLFSTRSHYPMLIFSDGANLRLSYYIPSQGRISDELAYLGVDLFQGEQVEEGGKLAPAYPITAVATAAHWSTGNPEIFWVQKGSRDHPGGQLYRMAYRPRR